MRLRDRAKAAAGELERQRRAAAADTRGRDHHAELARGVADDHLEALRAIDRWRRWHDDGRVSWDEMRDGVIRELGRAEDRHALLGVVEVEADTERAMWEDALRIANRPGEGRS